jgi:hypothetical protein
MESSCEKSLTPGGGTYYVKRTYVTKTPIYFHIDLLTLYIHMYS